MASKTIGNRRVRPYLRTAGVKLSILLVALAVNAAGLVLLTAIGYALSLAHTPFVTAIAYVGACVWMAPINLVLALKLEATPSRVSPAADSDTDDQDGPDPETHCHDRANARDYQDPGDDERGEQY